MDQVWYCGPHRGTRRDLVRPRGWLGLSGGDCDRLVRFIDVLGVEPTELHTHVPVGRIEGIDDVDPNDPMYRVLLGRWPYRIDAVLCFGAENWIVECKEDLTHFVLGQVLCYCYWWLRDVGGRHLTRAMIVCDHADVDVLPVAKFLGADVVVL